MDVLFVTIRHLFSLCSSLLQLVLLSSGWWSSQHEGQIMSQLLVFVNIFHHLCELRYVSDACKHISESKVIVFCSAI